MTNWLETLHAGANKLGLNIDEHEDKLFERFLDLLLERNAQVNLTAITDPAAIATKHFLDSLTVEKVWTIHDRERVIDIGTGGGFPGIPLAIRHPKVQFTLNDSVRKKIDFLRDASEQIPLPNVNPVWARAEMLGQDPQLRGTFTMAVARAVAHIGLLVEYALPLLKMGGVFIAMKGPSGLNELSESAHALDVIGGRVRNVQHFSLLDAGERTLIVIEKVKETPKSFPRDAGAMKKKPLFLDTRRSTP